ncbi:hypothetical protein TRFO_34606 [Tritrichomonas foetus]|uniref:Uncharacterized protein n=1 Tax=Tritrichomonas foetus TaxID=1144522 RepID=A0A1J4JKT0_9EUKA|nr:hypothetical protein TRFO_34606 [Tritrichomonas foetus]|eukprot:OHS98999.1 hypothetical protein TRFO_34606 [Tritrichomonas foetus]
MDTKPTIPLVFGPVFTLQARTTDTFRRNLSLVLDYLNDFAYFYRNDEMMLLRSNILASNISELLKDLTALNHSQDDKVEYIRTNYPEIMKLDSPFSRMMFELDEIWKDYNEKKNYPIEFVQNSGINLSNEISFKENYLFLGKCLESIESPIRDVLNIVANYFPPKVSIPDELIEFTEKALSVCNLRVALFILRENSSKFKVELQKIRDAKQKELSANESNCLQPQSLASSNISIPLQSPKSAPKLVFSPFYRGPLTATNTLNRIPRPNSPTKSSHERPPLIIPRYNPNEDKNTTTNHNLNNNTFNNNIINNTNTYTNTNNNNHNNYTDNTNNYKNDRIDRKNDHKDVTNSPVLISKESQPTISPASIFTAPSFSNPNSINSEIANLRGRIIEVEEDLKKSNNQVGDLTQKLEIEKSNLETSKAEVQKLKNENKNLQIKNQKLRDKYSNEKDCSQVHLHQIDNLIKENKTQEWELNEQKDLIHDLNEKLRKALEKIDNLEKHIQKQSQNPKEQVQNVPPSLIKDSANHLISLILSDL